MISKKTLYFMNTVQQLLKFTMVISISLKEIIKQFFINNIYILFKLENIYIYIYIYYDYFKSFS